MLTGKTVVLGVSGGIASYKMANLASMLVKLNAEVHVIMTKNATNFINPIAFESLTRTKCLVDTFDRNFQFDIKHVSLAKKADVILVAPATANVMAKFANGIADDMLTTTVLASRAVKIVSPSMNVNMYENPITQDNMKKLQHYGFKVIEADSGFLACRDVGKGKMPSEKVLLSHILKEIACEKDLAGKKVLVTAGATREAIDPVRFITNHSTGKMGCAIAERAMLRGAEVTLVAGHMETEPPMFTEVVNVTSAEDMFRAVKERFEDTDIVIKSAAVADYRPINISDRKIKKHDGDMSIELERTTDILKYLGQHKTKQFLCGFSMETENLIENSKAKLESKNIDMIVANNLKVAGAGFGTDTNIVTLISRGKTEELPIMSKSEVADKILDYIVSSL